MIDLESQAGGTLGRHHGGTGTTFGGAHEQLILPFVNDSDVGTIARGSVVTRTLANPKLHKTSVAGERILGVVVGRYSTTTGEFEDADPALDETAAVCVAGRCTVLLTGVALRDQYLRASTTAGSATPNTSALAGSFGYVIHPINSTLAQAVIGSVSSAGVPITDHGALTGLADDDHSAYVTVVGGGGETLSTIGATGTTETINLANGNVHDLTLDDDCLLALTGATAGVACSLLLILRQDGTGGRVVTWPGSVVWADGITPDLDPDPDAFDLFSLFTLDGGTTWYGFHATGAGGASALEDLTDVGLTAPAEDDTLRFNGSVWVNDARKWEVVTDGEDVFVWETDDLVYEWST